MFTIHPKIDLRIILLALSLGWLNNQQSCLGDDWATWPSTYTHDRVTGQRVDQYAQAESPVAPHRQDFSRSGYRHYRSTLQAGQSADNLHVVEQWGSPVVPYEQWRFPFRPYAVPYDAWGPQAPYGITNGYFGQGGGFGYGGLGFSGVPGNATAPTAVPPYGPGQYDPRQPGFGGGAPNGQPSRGFPLTPTYGQEPWYDGTYPSAPPLDGAGYR